MFEKNNQSILNSHSNEKPNRLSGDKFRQTNFTLKEIIIDEGQTSNQSKKLTSCRFVSNILISNNNSAHISTREYSNLLGKLGAERESIKWKALCLWLSLESLKICDFLFCIEGFWFEFWRANTELGPFYGFKVGWSLVT